MQCLALVADYEVFMVSDCSASSVCSSANVPANTRSKDSAGTRDSVGSKDTKNTSDTMTLQRLATQSKLEPTNALMLSSTAPKSSLYHYYFNYAHSLFRNLIFHFWQMPR